MSRPHPLSRSSTPAFSGRAIPRAILPFFFCLLLPMTALGAELRWQALPDRERISLRLDSNENVTGHIARITPTAVLIPFKRVPQPLIVESAPQGARIFAGSFAQGHSLALRTKDPAFGFLVSKSGPQEVVVDFFPDALGARWRPGHPAPAAERPADAPGQNAPLQQNALPQKGTPPQQDVQPQQDMPPQNKEQDRPTVISLAGSPIHAATVAAQAEPPAESPSATHPGMPRASGKLNDENGTPPRDAARQGGSPAPMPALDVRAQTAGRAAPLPVPEPPSAARQPVEQQAGEHDTKEATDTPLGHTHQAGPGLYRGAVSLTGRTGQTPRPPQEHGESSGHPNAAGKGRQPGAEGYEPDLAAQIEDLRGMAGNRDYPDALALAEALLRRNDLDAEQREELLHCRAEMLFAVHKDNFQGFYTPITDAATQAINFNIRSPRNAAALLRMGYMNLKLNNLPEAEASFNILRRIFPEDVNVPLSYYYQGEHYFGKNELQKAADEFQFILQKYPDSLYAREAALGLARSFYRLGYFEQASAIVDYIEKRWERFYLDYPPFLNMMGDVAYRLGKLDDALKHYWLYANLMPDGEEADIILTRIGDIYSEQRETRAATEMYKESMRRFPGRDGALVAMMRLAEHGINDNPSIAGMNLIFDGPFSLEPVKAYEAIIREHPQSGLVPLAKIKLAMWHLWKREFTTALDEVTGFVRRYPDHELAPRAKEIAMQAFAALASDSVAEGNYSRMHEIWTRYPIVHDQGEALSPDSRIALGLSYWKDNKPNEALDVLAPFFLGKKVPEYSEMALSLVLSMYLEYDQWQAVLDVARKVDLWELKPENSLQLDYAVALAHENLNQPEQAGPLWQKLYDSDKLPPAQKAYVSFFLARHAEKERQLEKAYMLGRESLSKLLEQAGRSNDPADTSKIKSQLASLMDIAETAGRLREALNYAEQYLQYLSGDESERTTVLYRMARIHKKQGSLDNWRKILAGIAAKNPDSVYGQIAASELRAAAIAEEATRFSPPGDQ